MHSLETLTPLHKKHCVGFTLVELLVVIAIIGLLASLLLPALSSTRSRASTSVCASNLRQIATGMINYATDNEGGLPYNYFVLTPRVEHFFMHKIIEGNYLPGSSNKVSTIFTCPDVNLSEIKATTVYTDVMNTYAANSRVVGHYNSGTWVFPRGTMARVDKAASIVFVGDGVFQLGPPTIVYTGFTKGLEIGKYHIVGTRSSPTTYVRYAHDGKPQAAYADGHVEAKDGPWPKLELEP